MKCYKYNSLLIIFCIYICFSFVKNDNTNLLSDSEFETDLLKLLAKLHQKKNNNLKKEKGLLNVRIKNVYDLREFFAGVNKYKGSLKIEKEEYNKFIKELEEKYTERLKENKKGLETLKTKFDNIIEKSNQVHKEINEKKTDQIQTKSLYQGIRPEYENSNQNFLDNILEKIKTFNSNSKNYLSFNKKVSDLNNDVSTREALQGNILKLKEKSKKYEIEAKHVKRALNESKMEKQLFNVIDSNLKNNLNEMKKGLLNTNDFIVSLRKVAKDPINLQKLEMEKSQQNETYKETNKQIKGLLTTHEKVQNEIKNLMKKKNKLKEELNAKDIESNIKMNKIKNSISTLESGIKQTEGKMLQNVKSQKTVYYIY